MFLNEGPEEGTFSFEAVVDDALTPTVRKSLDICQAFQTGACTNGSNCPDRHVITNLQKVQMEVCKFWLRGGCLNGADCAYLHAFEERLIPECAFFARTGECTNPECNFRHIHPDDKNPLCAAYERGFCPFGNECHLRHVKRGPPCAFYLAGFCPAGINCPRGPHPVQQRYDRFSVFSRLKKKLNVELADDPNYNPNVTCFKCFDPGHTARVCPGGYYGRVFNELRRIREPGEVQIFSDIDGRAVGCFLCGLEGHTLKDCPDGSSALGASVLRMLTTSATGNFEFGKLAQQQQQSSASAAPVLGHHQHHQHHYSNNPYYDGAAEGGGGGGYQQQQHCRMRGAMPPVLS